MLIDIQTLLQECLAESGIPQENIQLPDARLDPDQIHIAMIGEVPPKDPADSFYSSADHPNYLSSTLALFADAGVEAHSVDDLLQRGIYLTTAVKSPKTEYAVDPIKIAEHLPLLESELGLFPNLGVVMLMGDVAKKAFNMIAKKTRRKTRFLPVPRTRFGARSSSTRGCGSSPRTSPPAATSSSKNPSA